MRFLSSYKNSGRRCQGERLRTSGRMSFLSSSKRTRPSQRGWAISDRLAPSRFSAKVWTKLVTRRLLPFLEKHKVLQTNQFAFLPGRGTTSELIQLLNVLEEIQESNLEVDLSTSDVRGGFDSPERTA
jgi:hypothetical protein